MPGGSHGREGLGHRRGAAPEGYKLVRGDPAALRRFATQFRGRIGEAWRGYDARVLVRGERLNGAAVVVINAAEPTGGSDLIQGVEEAAGERDVGTQELTIAAARAASFAL